MYVTRPFFIPKIKVSCGRIQNINKKKESIVNILVDSKYRSIVAVLDKKNNIVVVNVADLGLSSNDSEGIEPIVEMMYAKSIDKDIDVIIASSTVCSRLEELGLRVKFIGVDDE